MGVQINGSEGNVIATKGTYSGNVTIGGTLTYEDVTNVDSVGLITARNGVSVSGGNIIVGSGITLSPDGDVFATGISTFGTGHATNPNADGGQVKIGGSFTQFQVHAGSQVGMSTFVFGDTQVGSAFTSIAHFEISNKTNTGTSIAQDDDSNVSYIARRDNGGDIGFILRHGTQNRERVRIMSDGKVGIGSTIPEEMLDVAGNIAIGTSTSGIAFEKQIVTSASGASYGSHLLDHYEEGTWTPSVKFDGNSTGMVYSVRNGNYTRIGRQVTLNFNIQLNNKGSSTGTATIEGLPFGVADSLSGTTVEASGVSAYWTNFEPNMYNMVFNASTDSGGSLVIRSTDADSLPDTLTGMTNSDFLNDSSFRGSITYFTNT